MQYVFVSPGPADMPAFANNIDSDQLASEKPTNLQLHCLSLSE